MRLPFAAAIAFSVISSFSHVSGATLPATEDSSSLKGNLTSGTNQATVLPVDATRSAFVYFDLAQIPADAEIRYARLRIYFPTAVRSGDGLTLHKVTSAWTEAAASPAPSFDPTPLQTFAPDTIKAKRFLSTDVTDTVKDWMANTNANEGFAIKAVPNANVRLAASVTIGSKEGSGTGYPAELEIEMVSSQGVVTAPMLAPNLTLAGTTTGTFVGDGSGLTNLPGGNGNTTTQQTGVGAVPRALSDRLNERVITAKDYGALGNGTADDYLALQNALNAAQTEHRPLFIPAGNYRLSAALKINTEAVVIYGAGSDQDGSTNTVLRPDYNVSAIEIATDSENLQLRDFAVVGHGVGNSTKPGIHFVIRDGQCTDTATVNNVCVKGMAIGIQADDVANCTFQGCDLGQNGVGFQSSGNSNANVIIACPTQENVLGGFRLLGGSGWSIIGGDHGSGVVGHPVVLLDGAKAVNFQGCNFEVGPGATCVFDLRYGSLTLLNNAVFEFGGGPLNDLFGVIQAEGTSLSIIHTPLPNNNGVSVKQLSPIIQSSCIGCRVYAQPYDYLGFPLPRYQMMPWRGGLSGDGVTPTESNLGQIEFLTQPGQSAMRVGVRDDEGNYFFADPLKPWFGADKIGATAHLNVNETFNSDKTFNPTNKLILGASTGATGGSLYWRPSPAGAASRAWMLRNDELGYGDFALTRAIGNNSALPTLPVLSVSGTNSDTTTAGLWGGAWTASALVSSGNVEAAASGTVHWKGRAALQSPADGVLNLTNSATNVSGTLRLATVQLNGTAGAPAQPVAGQIYFNSADKHFYGYDGTTWKQLDN